jgi:hypothetical protein
MELSMPHCPQPCGFSAPFVPAAARAATASLAPAATPVGIATAVATTAVAVAVPAAGSRARNWRGIKGASVRFEEKHKKWYARCSISKKRLSELGIEGVCKQRNVGRFSTQEECVTALNAALADVNEFMRPKKRGRKKL